MAEGLSVDFLSRINARERVVDSAKVPEISTSSLVSSRYTVETVPTNGSQFVAGQNPVIRLSSTADYLVPSSAALVVDLDIQDSASSSAWTDGSFCPVLEMGSFIDRARLLCSGILLEEVLFANRAIPALAIQTMTQAHTSQDGSTLYDAWKWSQTALVDTSFGSAAEASYLPTGVAAVDATSQVSAQGAVARGVAWYRRRYADGAANRWEVVLPLSMLFGLFRSQRFFPLRNAATLQIELNLAQNAEAITITPCVAYAGTPASPTRFLNTAGAPTPVYAVRNIYTLHDMVCLDPRYVALMDSIVASPEGMVMGIDTFTVLSATNVISNTSSTKNYTYSFGSPCLKSITFAKQLTQDANNYFESVGGFRSNNCLGTRLRLGKYFPMYDKLSTPEEIFYHNRKAQGQWGNVVDALGVQNWSNFKANDTLTGAHVKTIYLQKYLEGDIPEADGLDVRISGSVCQLEETSDTSASPADSSTNSEIVYALFEHLRILKMAGGNLSIEES